MAAFLIYFSGPDKHEDDDLIFEDFARLRLKESEHLGSADAWHIYNTTLRVGGEGEARTLWQQKDIRIPRLRPKNRLLIITMETAIWKSYSFGAVCSPALEILPYGWLVLVLFYKTCIANQNRSSYNTYS